ncbi:HlyD family type I secretion periplasmic adaptor subunit [Neotabrizicola shimadae]|uniref:Membrane fusion protein (MFP) family protein n=1 Tax=Neotabrizicola shimadae TaxID=2807096 RepID=A0A8G1EDD2_9RHOB|nr:HlyD family type I secretion periplasmic adaptor subunit [Neotabrizicola shimadae]QYZ70048.1 HlyD family type I secretion periplasmic adaptor subunit [Neotabrizicola shimadae]
MSGPAQATAHRIDPPPSAIAGSMRTAANRQVSAAVASCDAMVHRSLRSALIVIFLTFGVTGTWLALARLDSAVVAQGVVENASTTRLIQHLEGGIVAEILVRNGQTVRQGDVLVRFDPTQSAATADLFSTQILGNQLRQERLQAEIDMAETLVFSPALAERLTAMPDMAKVADNERKRFELQRKELLQSRDLLQTNVAQAQKEIEASEVARDIARREAALVQSDLEDQKSLRERGLASQSRVTELEQASLGLEERIAQADISIARIQQQIIGVKLQIAQLEQEYRGRAADEMEAVTREIRSLERDSIIAKDSLKRIELRSPVDGIVQESTLGTVGAVVPGGATIMKIAPLHDEFVIVSRIAPNDIDGIAPDSEALITFPAYQLMDLPPAKGKLLTLSRDRIVDPQTRADFYEARIRLDLTSLPEGPRSKLVAGMSATTILPTGERSALSYLIGPLQRRLHSAMREE